MPPTPVPKGSRTRLSRAELRILGAVADLVYPDQPALSSPEAEQAREAADAFVAARVAALPSYLRPLYRAALLGFGYLPLLRYAAPFASLERSRRQAYLRAWSDGPIGVCRDFVKLIRSCALLAYFDHPAVRSALEAAPPGSACGSPSVSAGG